MIDFISARFIALKSEISAPPNPAHDVLAFESKKETYARN
jgi:hypothetical protein